MDLHELESAWKSLDQRVARQDEELAQLRTQARGLRGRWRLHVATLGQVAQIAIGLLLAIWGGGFWVDHWGTPHLVAYGMAVHIYGIALLASAIVLILRMAAIDYGQPVADVQSRLLALRRARIVTERILWIFGAIAWVPMLMMGLAAIGFDPFLHRPSWVWWNLAVGGVLALVAGAVMVWKPAWFASISMDGALREVDRQIAEFDSLRLVVETGLHQRNHQHTGPRVVRHGVPVVSAGAARAGRKSCATGRTPGRRCDRRWRSGGRG